MRPATFIVLSFLCFTTFVNFKVISAQDCEKEEDGFDIICTNIKDKFPVLNDTKQKYMFIVPIVKLKCIECSLPTINSETIGTFDGHYFDISNSSVKTIESTAFQEFSSDAVKSLFFNRNDITSIGLGVFQRFKELEQIQFQHNKLSSLKRNQFEKVSVRNLDLSYNQLSSIDLVFDELTVQALNLSYNSIENVENGAFQKVGFTNDFRHKLVVLKPSMLGLSTTLDLSHNKIYSLKNNSFVNSGQLQILYLNNNRISMIAPSSFNQLYSLRLLHLNNNSINSLDPALFNNLGNLTTLQLSNNKISTLPNGIFKSLQNLQTLVLSYNKLKTLGPTSFSGLISLYSLDVSYNDLTRLRDSDLFMLGKIKELDVGGNRLQNLNIKDILMHNKDLQRINVNDNFWTCKALMTIYKEINKNMGEFSKASNHYSVPNLHGIACSKEVLDIKDEMTFEKFLDIIAVDAAVDDLYDTKSNDEMEEAEVEYLKKIYCMVLIMGIIAVSFVGLLFILCVLSIVTKGNLSNTLNFLYRVKDDKIELINQP